MNKIVFQVKFLSDIVLQASSNTEGNIEHLDFIPGSNFLGMVAQNYMKFEDSFKVFHSGDVKFGDAHILKDEKVTYKMPLSFFHEKLDAKTLYNHHFIQDFSTFKQLKQKRDGYITKDMQTTDIEYNYSQKSAYDKDNRRSKDSSMYGYKAIKSGTKWQFILHYKEDISQKDLELIKQSLVGKKRLGKSKSSQYGLVDIKINGKDEDIQKQDRGELILYANSRLCLVDTDGNATLDLSCLFKNLKSSNIDYTKTQLKTSTFTPYNGARKTKDYERICINKGSVIVLRDIEQDKIPNFVGAYQSEGFGELLINPTFLMQKDGFSFSDKEQKDKDKATLEINDNLAKFLKAKEEAKKLKLDKIKKVSEFKKKYKNTLYKNIKPSQWGTIRAICNKREENFKEEIKNHISNGVKKWEQNQIDTLLRFSDDLDTIKLLSIQMPKGDKND
jgi:hypothetical protein